MAYHFQNVPRNSVRKVNGNSEIRVPVSGFCGHYARTLNGTTSIGERNPKQQLPVPNHKGRYARAKF